MGMFSRVMFLPCGMPLGQRSSERRMSTWVTISGAGRTDVGSGWVRDGMTKKSRHRIDLDEADHALLVMAAARFGLTRSELMRRLVRAALDVGPALSEENSRTVGALTSQVRMVGRNLMQVLHAIHSGRAVHIADAEPVWSALHERVREMDEELTAMTVAYGVRLRASAGMAAGASGE